MAEPSVVDAALLLEHARLKGEAVAQLTAGRPGFSLEEAYKVQDEIVAMRLHAGDAVAGYKMGLTSKAKMKQMGVDWPIMGVLMESMRLPNGGAMRRRGLIHPRVEPEVAFVMGRELSGKVSAEQALQACSGVCAALEILDSRFKDFKFTLPDVVADNTSGCRFVLGEVRPLAGLALDSILLEMSVDGKPAASGLSSEIYGHPAASLAELSAMMAARGRSIPAGCVVLAGAATQAVPLGAEVLLKAGPLGEVSLRAA